jgi:hypothetical protein
MKKEIRVTDCGIVGIIYDYHGEVVYQGFFPGATAEYVSDFLTFKMEGPIC